MSGDSPRLLGAERVEVSLEGLLPAAARSELVLKPQDFLLQRLDLRGALLVGQRLERLRILAECRADDGRVLGRHPCERDVVDAGAVELDDDRLHALAQRSGTGALELELRQRLTAALCAGDRLTIHHAQR